MADDISLRELIEILLHRRSIIIIITLGALLASFILSYFIIPPVYQASAVLKNTDYQTGVALKLADYQANGGENTAVLRTAPEDYVPLVQEEEFLERVAASKDLPGGYGPMKISQMIGVAADNDKGLLVITVTGKDAAEVALLANTAAAEFVDFSWQAEKGRLQKIMEYWQEQLAATDQQLEEVLAELEDRQARGLWSGHLEQEAVAFGTARAELKISLHNLSNEIATLVHTRPFAVSSLASPPTAPVSPRRSLNLALAGMLGLMVGIFTAFFVDYWQKSAPAGNGE
ncbi:MAG TPA: hypothetical protein GX735_00675 [Firmicutes bacterium]|nr:hypothetical protein [Bacillota bacterium]